MAALTPGYKQTPIGTKKHPWLTQLLGEDAKGNRIFATGVIQSDENPLFLPSTRPYNEITPELLAKMPTPNMLEAFEAICQNWLVHLISDPAYGKSFLATLIGNVMHKDGAVMVDAADMDLSDLLCKTIFDSNTSSNFMQRIDQALKEETLTPVSLKALRELKNSKDEPLLSEENGKMVFDWNGLENSNIARAEIDSVFASVKACQEWNGSTHFGFKDVEGALVRAARERRPLAIDEFLRHKAGTAGALHQVLQVISGEIASIEIPMKNLGTFTLRHGDIPRVIMTSNKPKDGEDITLISDSLRSRLVEINIPPFDKDSWAHRVSQILTGLPTTSLAQLREGKLSAGATKDDVKWQVTNPAQYIQYLQAIQTANGNRVPEWQQTLVENALAVNEVSAALGLAYHASVQLLDADSALLKTAGMAKIRMEVDNPDDPAAKVSPRDLIRAIDQAVNFSVDKKPATEVANGDFTDWSMPIIEQGDEAITENLGTRLKDVIERFIDNAAGVSKDGIARPQLYTQLKKTWKEAGILGKDSILDKLNVKDRTVELSTPVVDELRDAVNLYLKNKYPDFAGIPSARVEAYFEGLKEQEPKEIKGGFTARVLSGDANQLANGDFLSEIAILSNPENGSAKEADGLNALCAANPAAKLMDQERFVATLTLPFIGKELLKASVGSQAFDAPNTNCVAGTVMVGAQKDGAAIYGKIHVLHNKEKNTTLVVTNKPISLELPDSSSVTIVYSGGKKAEEKVKKWLDSNANDAEKSSLLQRFQEQNTNPDKLELEDVLVAPQSKSTCYRPIMLSNQTEMAR